MNKISFGMWAAMALILAPWAGAQSYTVTDLGVLPSATSSYSLALNDQGAVVGYSSGPELENHAFLWTVAKGMQDLGTLVGDYSSVAIAVNNAGEVVGGSEGNGLTRAFYWTATSGIQDLGVGINTFAQGINNSGEIVGYNGDSHAFVWTAATGAQDLGTLGGTISSASGINDSGEVVGYSNLLNYDGDHAFLWTKSGGMMDIHTLGDGENSIAYGINASGQVSGSAGTLQGSQSSALLWTPSRGMQILGAASPSEALGINTSGEIVGDIVRRRNTWIAFLWTAKGHVQNLNDLIPANSGWILTTAIGVNGVGQISATGMINGQSHAALLTPVN